MNFNSAGILTYSLSNLAYRVGVLRSMSSVDLGTHDEAVERSTQARRGATENTAVAIAKRPLQASPDLSDKVVRRFAELERHNVEKVEEVYKCLQMQLDTARDLAEAQDMSVRMLIFIFCQQQIVPALAGAYGWLTGPICCGCLILQSIVSIENSLRNPVWEMLTSEDDRARGIHPLEEDSSPVKRQRQSKREQQPGVFGSSERPVTVSGAGDESNAANTVENAENLLSNSKMCSTSIIKSCYSAGLLAHLEQNRGPLSKFLDSYFEIRAGARDNAASTKCDGVIPGEADLPFQKSSQHKQYIEAELRGLYRYIAFQDGLPQRVRAQLGKFCCQSMIGLSVCFLSHVLC